MITQAVDQPTNSQRCCDTCGHDRSLGGHEDRLVALLRGPKLSDVRLREAMGMSRDQLRTLIASVRARLEREQTHNPNATLREIVRAQRR